MSTIARGTNQSTTSRGFFGFFGGKHFSFVPTLENVFGAISGSDARTSEDLLLQRAANDAAQR